MITDIEHDEQSRLVARRFYFSRSHRIALSRGHELNFLSGEGDRLSAVGRSRRMVRANEPIARWNSCNSSLSGDWSHQKKKKEFEHIYISFLQIISLLREVSLIKFIEKSDGEVIPKIRSPTGQFEVSSIPSIGVRNVKKIYFPFVSREFRVLILKAACTIGHNDCLETAGRMLKNYLWKKNARPLPADIRSIVYSFGEGKEFHKYFPPSCFFIIHDTMPR